MSKFLTIYFYLRASRISLVASLLNLHMFSYLDFQVHQKRKMAKEEAVGWKADLLKAEKIQLKTG